MTKRNVSLFLSAAVLGLALTGSARATSVTLFATAPAGYSATTFLQGNASSGPGSWTFGGTASIQTSSTPGSCLDPLGSGVTAGFVCTKGGSTVTADFAGGITGFDLLWGSPDGYNTLTFYTGPNGTGTAESFVPGVPPLTVTTPPLAAPVLFVAAPGVVWDSVTFSSVFNSFEFGNIETLAATSSTPAPEPSTALLLVSGFLVVGFGIRRFKRS
jgi:hypothetical protein